MKASLTTENLVLYVSRQLANIFPDEHHHNSELAAIIDKALARLAYCFSHIDKKYYQVNNMAHFNHLNSDHYCSFIYLLSNEAYRDDAIVLAEKLFYLNKALNGLDCFYSIKLPDIFLFVHPVGTVLGNAEYANYLVVYQNVTVGSTLAGDYPRFNEACILYSNASIIGDCQLGENVIVGANSALLNTEVEPQRIIVGMHPNCKIKNTQINIREEVFGLNNKYDESSNDARG